MANKFQKYPMKVKDKILIFIDMEMILRHFIANETFKELIKIMIWYTYLIMIDIISRKINC